MTLGTAASRAAGRGATLHSDSQTVTVSLRYSGTDDSDKMIANEVSHGGTAGGRPIKTKLELEKKLQCTFNHDAEFKFNGKFESPCRQPWLPGYLTQLEG